MTNLEIAKAFNEEDSFRQNIVGYIATSNQFTVGYIIYAADHEPLTEKQKELMLEYGNGDEIELVVEFNIDSILN